MTRYYWSKEKDTIYHWHPHCSGVPLDLERNKQWEKGSRPPGERGKCEKCEKIDGVIEFKDDIKPKNLTNNGQ